jgi:UDP-N-acetylmuramoyl-tripeptide--D-alanyl-D-alanine ligase
VLGELRELGDSGAEAHEEIGRLAARLGIDRLVVVGEQAEGFQHGARLEGSDTGKESVLVPDVEAAVALLDTELRPGDVVLVKAANLHGLWRIADALLGSRA